MRLVGANDVANGPEGQPMQPTNTASSSSLGEEQPPVRRSSTQLNRERVQDHQRLVAGESLLHATALVGAMAIVCFGLVVASIVIYTTGWMVWSKNREKPCDQPLQWWLFIILLMPIIQCQLSSNADPQRPKRLQMVIMPALLISGIYMLSHSKTCEETNPKLYQFVKLYVIFQSTLWLTMVFTLICFVSVLMWAHSRGLLQGSGPSTPAKPGTIDEIQTVPFDADMLAEMNLGDNEQPECSICQDTFSSEKEIKRTPCAHFFHKECLAEWLEKYNNNCPLCRSDLEEAVEQSALP